MTTTTINTTAPSSRTRSCGCARSKPVLTEKGYIDPAALDALIDAYETKIGPHRGARVVAKAWADPEFERALLADATGAIRDAGLFERVSDHLIAVANRRQQHNVVVCTLCSCYPWGMLGLPPVWYKSAPYRSRAVSDPRGVLREFGVDCPRDRYPGLGLHRRDPLHRDSHAPGGHRGLERREARRLGHPQRYDRHRPSAAIRRAAMNGVHDMGGMHGFGPVSEEPNEPVFHGDWEGRLRDELVTRSPGSGTSTCCGPPGDAAAARLSVELLL